MTPTFSVKGSLLTRDAMKKIQGGLAPGLQAFYCSYVAANGSTQILEIDADNADQAQAKADYIAYSDEETMKYPQGIDCPGAGGVGSAA